MRFSNNVSQIGNISHMNVYICVCVQSSWKFVCNISEIAYSSGDVLQVAVAYICIELREEIAYTELLIGALTNI